MYNEPLNRKFQLNVGQAPRYLFPTLAAAIHVPMRMLSEAFLSRTIHGLFGGQSKLSKGLANASAALAMAAFASGLFFFAFHQSVLYIAQGLVIITHCFVVRKSPKDTGLKFMYGLAVVFSVGYGSDCLRMLAEITNSYYPLKYTNRYLTPPFLLGCVAYLAFQLTSESARNLRETTFEEALAQVRHDMQSPLFALKQILRDQSLEPELQKIFGATVTRIDQISNSIGSLDALNEDVHAFDVLAAISALLEEKRVQYQNHKFAIESEPGALAVEANLPQFNRVLSNIIHNAIEATTEGQKIRVLVQRIGRWATISVIDTGRGIPVEILAAIGKRGRTFGKTSGTGLGLYHAHKMARTWGGKLEILSKPTSGTTVRLLIPVV